MSTEDKTIHIRNELAGRVLDLSVAVITIGAEAWQAQANLGDRFRFGWAPPMVLENEDLLVVGFSPELIAAITADLSDEDLAVYLDVVGDFLEALVDDIESPTDDVMRAVEDHLYQTNPEALELLSKVEAAALDGGIALGSHGA